jgi:hypothetical protein
MTDWEWEEQVHCQVIGFHFLIRSGGNLGMALEFCCRSFQCPRSSWYIENTSNSRSVDVMGFRYILQIRIKRP